MSPVNGQSSSLVINMFRMRPGVSSERFAEFSARLDQPTLHRHRNVVTRFDVYRVLGATEASPLGVDIVEIMAVTEWAQWARVRDRDASMSPVTSGFDELVDPLSVRSSLVVPVLRGQQA